MCFMKLKGRLFAASSHAERREEDPADEAGAADDVRLGNKGAVGPTGRLRSPESALRLVGQ